MIYVQYLVLLMLCNTLVLLLVSETKVHDLSDPAGVLPPFAGLFIALPFVCLISVAALYSVLLNHNVHIKEVKATKFAKIKALIDGE